MSRTTTTVGFVASAREHVYDTRSARQATTFFSRLAVHISVINQRRALIAYAGVFRDAPVRLGVRSVVGMVLVLIGRLMAPSPFPSLPLESQFPPVQQMEGLLVPGRVLIY